MPTAAFENGMLRLDIPRAEQAKPRQIPVTRSRSRTPQPAEAPAAEVGAGTVPAGQA